MDKKGVMMEEWKARRKEWKKKRKGKKGKGEKVVLAKVLFCFCLTVCLRHPSPSPALTTPPPQHTLTFITHIIQQDALVHTITCKQGCVLCCLFFWEWTARHTLHHPHLSLHHLTSHKTHKQTQHRHSPWCKQQRDDNCR